MSPRSLVRAVWLAMLLTGLGLLLPALRPALAASPRLADPLPPAVVEARLVALQGPADLTVESGGRAWHLSVRGVRDDPVCEPDRRLAWARRILAAGTPLQLGAADRWGARSVRFLWQGRLVDWAFVLLRAGQAFPGGSPDEPARLPEAYAWAAREARAEGRGLWGECGRALQRFRRVGQLAGIPAEVLYGIAMAESGLAGAPWPWTLNVAGRPLHFASRQQAAEALARLAAQGERQVDVGMMQVSLAWHGRRFADCWQALDPESNQQAAAAILREEWQRTGSLARAVARYHSADPLRGSAYLARVRGFVDRARASATPALPADLRPIAQPKGPPAGARQP